MRLKLLSLCLLWLTEGCQGSSVTAELVCCVLPAPSDQWHLMVSLQFGLWCVWSPLSQGKSRHLQHLCQWAAVNKGPGLVYFGCTPWLCSGLSDASLGALSVSSPHYFGFYRSCQLPPVSHSPWLRGISVSQLFACFLLSSFFFYYPFEMGHQNTTENPAQGHSIPWTVTHGYPVVS